MAVSVASRGRDKIEPTSSHTADPVLQPFIQTDFDPIEYFNNTLPSLAASGVSKDPTGRVSLADLSTSTQALLSQLNVQTTRLCNILTQLTDEILRSGSRLAYEVEILRGEAVGLSDTLSDSLKQDIASFSTAVSTESDKLAPSAASAGEPEYIKELRTLALVRSRLDAVIKVFGDAMAWPLAPSELTSSLISVAAPGVSAEENRNREERGKEAIERLRREIATLLEEATSTEEGIAAATQRIVDLKSLAVVWSGTAEEKARNRHIESLSKLVEEQQKKVQRRAEGRRQATSSAAGMDYRYGPTSDSTRSVNEGGYGFMSNLRRLKGDTYPD